MDKIALVLILAFPLVTGAALSSAFAVGLLPLLSNDACIVVKDGSGQLPHFAALLPSLFTLARVPVLVRRS